MPRVTNEERKRFHDFVDEAIDKINLPKNEKKAHWGCLENRELVDLLTTETFELRHAVFYPHHGDIKDECKDVINFALMISDNAVKGKM
jgi:hypothetical protein